MCERKKKQDIKMAARFLLTRLPSRALPMRTLSTLTLRTQLAKPQSTHAQTASATTSVSRAPVTAAAAGATALATAAALAALTLAPATVQAEDATVPPTTAVVPGELSKEAIAATAAAIHDLLDDVDDDGLGPTLVRLAWHSSGTYDKESRTGGSEGATMRFKPESEHGANAGLHIARIALEPVKKLFPEIS